MFGIRVYFAKAWLVSGSGFLYSDAEPGSDNKRSREAR